MSKKKEKEWKQRLTAAMNAEAEEIEKQAEPFRAVLSEEKKAEIYQNIMEKIQEDEKTSSAADPLSEKKAAGAEELSSRRKTASRKSFWRQPLKLTGVLAAAVVLIFSMTLTSEGNRMYWLGRWRGLFGYDDVEQSNNGGDRIQTETSEQEAREQAWEELGIAMPEFYYVPEDMSFESASIDLPRKRVVFQYISDKEYLYLTAIKNDIDATVQSRNPNGNSIREIKAGAKGDSIEVMIAEDESGGEEHIIYKGKWNYQNCGYEFGNIMDKEELIKILENMQYIQ